MKKRKMENDLLVTPMPHLEIMDQNSNIAPIVVYGPTACGKTALSLELARAFNGEIINTDSRQLYRDLDIGTGKITSAEMGGIPHHLLDILGVEEKSNVGSYRELAIAAVEEIASRGKTPILCGGTGLYIDAVIFELDIPAIPADEQYRAELEKIAAEQGTSAVWEMLQKLDPEYAAELHPNNLHYIMRALEVLKWSGKSKTSHRSERTLRYPKTRFITPYQDSERANLYNRIDARVGEMFASGLVEEAKELLAKYSADAIGLATIGYAEVVDFLLERPQEFRQPDGTIISRVLSLDETRTLVAQHHRNYAKRQISWNKRYEKWTHLDFSI